MVESDSAARERPFAALPNPEGDEPAAKELRGRGAFEFPEAIGIFFLLLIAAACGGLIAVYWPWMLGQSTETAATSDRLTAIESRVEQMAAGRAPNAAAQAFANQRKALDVLKTRLDADEARLTAMEKSSGQLESGPVIPAQTGDLAASNRTLAQLRKDLDDRAQAANDLLAKLGQRVTSVEANAPPPNLAQQLQSFSLKTDVVALDSRISKLESRDSAELMRRAASILALANLERVSASGAPFSGDWATLHALAPDAPELKDLENYANKGVLARASLIARFSHRADAILSAEQIAQAKNWAQRLWVHIESLISIRPVGNVKGNTTQALLARAEFDLRRGDLPAAVKEVDALDAPGRAAANDWLSAALARLAVERDIRSLSNRMLAAVAAPLPARVGNSQQAPASPPP